MSIYATTIIGIRRGESTIIAGDGQATMGSTIIKSNVKKVRKVAGEKSGIIAGFAGSTADAFTLFERLEHKLSKHSNQLLYACVELAKDWRNDKYLRRLEAMMIVANKDSMFMLSGQGDVLEPQYDCVAIGSGANYAFAAARAYLENKKLSIKDVALKSLGIAADLCIYTNHNIAFEEI